MHKSYTWLLKGDGNFWTHFRVLNTMLSIENWGKLGTREQAFGYPRVKTTKRGQLRRRRLYYAVMEYVSFSSHNHLSCLPAQVATLTFLKLVVANRFWHQASWTY
jgi:hypothetical protein